MAIPMGFCAILLMIQPHAGFVYPLILTGTLMSVGSFITMFIICAVYVPAGFVLVIPWLKKALPSGWHVVGPDFLCNKYSQPGVFDDISDVSRITHEPAKREKKMEKLYLAPLFPVVPELDEFIYMDPLWVKLTVKLGFQVVDPSLLASSAADPVNVIRYWIRTRAIEEIKRLARRQDFQELEDSTCGQKVQEFVMLGLCADLAKLTASLGFDISFDDAGNAISVTFEKNLSGCICRRHASCQH
jgi:hypothetical protein